MTRVALLDNEGDPVCSKWHRLPGEFQFEIGRESACDFLLGREPRRPSLPTYRWCKTQVVPCERRGTIQRECALITRWTKIRVGDELRESNEMENKAVSSPRIKKCSCIS